MFRYFGSKSSTAEFVADVALDGINAITAADAFGGLGNIGAALKRRGCKVTTCDMLSFPNAFQHARIECQLTPRYSKVRRELGISTCEELLELLNCSQSGSDWFVREYSEKRRFFTPDNAYRISATWSLIARWNRKGWLSEKERKFAIASFLNNADSCANTAGTYYAYLKNWYRKAKRPYRMEWLPIESGPAGKALQGDAFECLAGQNFDVLYLDPPYNSRDYARYYHLPETLAKLRARRIDPNSHAGQPIVRATEGKFIRSAMRLSYLQKLIESVGWKRLVVQYADGAYIKLTDLKIALRKYGNISQHTVPALGYRTTAGKRNHVHYVIVVE